MTSPRPLAILCAGLIGAATAPLLGCGDNLPLGPLRRVPIPGCEAHDPTPCDVRTLACQQRLHALASCLSGEPAGEMPPVTVMTEDEFSAYLTAQAQGRPPFQKWRETEAAFSLLHLVRAGAFDPEQTLKDDAAFYWGIYRSESKDVLVVDHGDVFDEQAGSAILIHEFVHALQDRALSLDAFAAFQATSDDRLLAARAIIEGEARMHEDRYLVSAAGFDPARVDLDRRIAATIERFQALVARSQSPYLDGARNFPYLWGTRHMRFVWEGGGRDAVRAQFMAPPNTTRTLLAETTAPSPPEPEPARLARPRPSAEWAPLSDLSLGAWGTWLLLRVHDSDSTKALAAARELLTDGFWIYEAAAGGSVAAVWRGDFATAEAASTASTILRGPFSSAVDQRNTRVTVALSTAGGAPLFWAFVPEVHPTTELAESGEPDGARPNVTTPAVDRLWPGLEPRRTAPTR